MSSVSEGWAGSHLQACQQFPLEYPNPCTQMMLLGEGRQQGWLWAAAVLPLPSLPFCFVGRHSPAIQHTPC